MLRTIFDPYSDLFLEYIETTKKNDMQTWMVSVMC